MICEGKCLWQQSFGTRRFNYSAEVVAADTESRHLIYFRSSIRSQSEAWAQAEGAHFKHLLWLYEYSLPNEPKALRIILKWRLKSATEGRIWFSFFANIEINWCYVMLNCFHFVKIGTWSNYSYIKTTVVTRKRMRMWLLHLHFLL
jgi:hypothetical protein